MDNAHNIWKVIGILFIPDGNHSLLLPKATVFKKLEYLGHHTMLQSYYKLRLGLDPWRRLRTGGGGGKGEEEKRKEE